MYWNLYTVLKHTINPGGRLPYLVITTHCHFDHILGLGLLPPTDTAPHHLNITQRKGPLTTVLSSAHSIEHISPWKHVCCHSLSKEFHTECPYYTIEMWAQDRQDVVYSPSTSTRVPTGITIHHTPGHSPDSLSWYDTDSHLLCVGDSFYETKSQDTQEWEVERKNRAAILFEERSHLLAWWKSLDKLLEFTKEENTLLASQHTGSGPPPRVAISASHVTTTSPDAEPFLLSIRTFMHRILRDEVPKRPLARGELPFKDVMVYDDGPEAAASKDFDWIVCAPKRIIEEGVQQIEGRTLISESPLYSIKMKPSNSNIIDDRASL
ncbi:unnamed protein product [Penicillium glandicola]